MTQGNSRQGRTEPRMRAGGQWSSAECTQKAEVMLRKALLSQAAVAAVLEAILPEGGPAVDRALKAGEPNLQDIAVSPRLLETMRSKLIDSMEWNQLVHDRIKEMIAHEKSESLISAEPPGPGAVTDKNPADASTRVNGMPLNVVESHGLFTGEFNSQIAAPHVPASEPLRGEREQIQQSMIDYLLSDEEHVIDLGGQNITRILSSLGLDHSEWNNILSADSQLDHIHLLPGADPPNVLPTESGPAPASSEVAHHSSSTLPEAATDVNIDDRSLGIASQGSRGTGSSKRVRDECSEEKDWGPPVYQMLRPGSAVDKKKGIPYDGHQRWKKYGTKRIETYTYPRGYYKCSTSNNCAAKKRVTPTNNNPSIYEVAYKHEHTCSATSIRSSRSCPCKTTAPTSQLVAIDVDISQASKRRCSPHVAEAGSLDAAPRILGDDRVQTKIARLMNVDEGKSTATLPAIEVAGCETSLPKSRSSFSEAFTDGAPCDVTESVSALEEADHDANPDLHQNSIDLTFWGHLSRSDIDMDVDTILEAHVDAL